LSGMGVEMRIGFLWRGHGPVEVVVDPRNGQPLIRSLLVMTCPKCGGYMTTVPVDFLSASLTGRLGRWRCQSCGYIPSLDIYDKRGAEMEKRLLKSQVEVRMDG